MRQLSFGQQFRLVQAESRGAGRRFLFFVLCLAIGVGAVMMIKSFSSLIENSIKRESKGLLSADIEIKSSWAQKKEDIAYQEGALPIDTRFVFVKELHAMAQFSKNRQGVDKPSSLLVELKAVPSTPPLYPLYGEIKIAPEGDLQELLKDRGALVERNFLIKTGLDIGDTFLLGKIKARISAVIEAEPDRISRAFSIGPRVMVSLATLDAAQLIAPGSRVKHRTLIGLPDGTNLDNAFFTLQDGLTDKAASLRTYEDMQSSLTQSIKRISNYLGTLGVIALLMGGIGVAMIVRTFMAQKLDTIAILTCLGARPKTIFKIYLLQALFLGLAGSLLGIGVGYALQFLLPSKLEGLLHVSLTPVFEWQPAAQALLLGMGTTLLFALWPLVRAVRTKPLRLFRHIAEEEELTKGSRSQRWLVGILFTAGLAGSVFWQAESVTRGLIFLIALAVAALLLLGVSSLVLKFLKRLPPSPYMTRRYGLANLYRPNNQARSIITAIGMGIMLVLAIRLVQMDLISMLKENTKGTPPNYFFIDIQKDQENIFSEVMTRTAPEAKVDITPLVRARISQIDGKKIANWEYTNRAREEWFINREFVLTYSRGDPPPGNEVVDGKWWTPEEASTPQVSLEEDAAKRLGAKVGSTLIMDIQGIPVEAPVTNIRKVDWRNMRTNFYMIFSPGALEGAPLTFVASVTVDKSKELAVQTAVVQALPNVTALGTRDIIETVETVVGKLLTLVDFMSTFAILSGLIILSGAVASTKFRRLKEAAILKTLGAKKRAVAAILGYEYATLGAIAAVVGVTLSVALSWAVMEYAVKSPWQFRPGPLALALIISIILTTLTGVLSSLDVLRNKPSLTLRKLDS